MTIKGSALACLSPTLHTLGFLSDSEHTDRGNTKGITITPTQSLSSSSDHNTHPFFFSRTAAKTAEAQRQPPSDI